MQKDRLLEEKKTVEARLRSLKKQIKKRKEQLVYQTAEEYEKELTNLDTQIKKEKDAKQKEELEKKNEELKKSKLKFEYVHIPRY